MCAMCPTCNHKKAGRKPKYTNDVDRKKAKQEQTNKCAKNYYDINKESINERIKVQRKQISMQKKEEKLINLFLNKLNRLNIDKMDVIQRVIKYLHV